MRLSRKNRLAILFLVLILLLSQNSGIIFASEPNSLTSSSVLGSSSAKPYFAWWGNPKELSHPNIIAPSPKEDISYWVNRGAVPCGFVGLGSKDIGYIDHGMTQEFKDEIEKRVAEGFPGIALEIERTTDNSDAQVLQQFKLAHPQIFICAWLSGGEGDHSWVELGNCIDLFLYEVYINIGHSYAKFDSYIDLARKYNILSKSVFALGTENAISESIEDQLIYIRNKAPEMPGAAFFKYDTGAPDISAACNSLCKKYFLDPVLTVSKNDISFSDNQPQIGEAITINAKVHDIGNSDANNISIKFFDGNPSQGGGQIGQQQISVSRYSTATASIEWKADKRITDLYVQIGPQAGITILNATASKEIVAGALWWNRDWNYRVPIVVPENDFDVTNRLVEVEVDFTELLKQLGAESEIFDVNSIRVVEYANQSENYGTEVPSQFETVASSSGTLSWVTKGTTPAGCKKYYYIYFDTLQNSSKTSPEYQANLKQDGWTFWNNFYSLGLDPNHGFTISELASNNSSQNAMGLYPWGFYYETGGGVYKQYDFSNPDVSVNQGPVFTTVTTSYAGGGAAVLTKYYLYDDAQLIRVHREFEPGPGAVSYAFEETASIPEHQGTYSLGWSTISSNGALADQTPTERYFGGALGPGNEYKAGWFDWSWPSSLNSGFGVAIYKRWTNASSSLYDITRHYDASDAIQIWEIFGGDKPILCKETSDVYLIPHNYCDFTDPGVVPPAYKVWRYTHEPIKATYKPETLSDVTSPAPSTATLALSKGFNFISLPLMPGTSYTARSLLESINSQGGDAVQISRWDNQGGVWQSLILAIPPNTNNFEVKVGEAYLVKCNKESIWKVTGDEITQPLSYNLGEGWNGIGIPCGSYTAKAWLEEMNSQGAKIGSLAKWDTEDWSWVTYPPLDFFLKKGEGYFVLVDKTPPEVTISSPTDNSYVRGEVEIGADASDVVGREKVEFYVDDTLRSTDTSPPYTYDWNTVLETDGAYTLKAIAYDTAGNQGSDEISVTVDNTPPTTSGTPYLSAGTNPNNTGTCSISWTSSTDTGSGLKEYQVFRNGLQVASVVTNSYSETDLDQGSYSYYVVAVDNVGNTSLSSITSTAIVVDKTSPTGTVLINNGSTYTKSTSVTLNLSAIDTGGSGLYQMQFSNDNLNWSAPETYATSKAWTLTTGDGTRTVYAKFSDKAGNWSAVYSDTIILDTTKPTITKIYDSPDPFYTKKGQVSKISYTLGDNLSTTLTTYTYVYTLAGSLIRTLGPYTQNLGANSVIWNGKNSSGVYVANGVYKYRIGAQDKAGNYIYSSYYYVTKR